MDHERTIIASHDGSGRGAAGSGGSVRLALVALSAVLGSFACVSGGHVEAPAQPRASGDLATLLSGAELAQYRDTPAGGNRLGDTPARADEYSRLAAGLASETGTAHINDAARRVRYNGAYFEVDVEVNGERGVVPVTWEMLRAHTPLVSRAYYARVYISRGWVNGRQVPGFGPDVILPEAFTPELTPVLFEYFKQSFMGWNRDFDGWKEAMADAWLKTAAIHVARAWTPEFVGGVAVASARASQITGKMALGAAAVPNAATAARACSGGRCPCFVAGTPVATVDGPIAIEHVAVGQRVLSASPACIDSTAEDAAALTNYHLQIRAADGDVFVIELLRPREWPHAPGARPGDVVYVELDEINIRGLALVTAWEPHPNIDMDSTHGCLVTGTVSHTATTLSVLRLVDEQEPLIATPWHRMYSHARSDWVAIEDLAAGELLRTADGTIAVESVVELGDQHEPVFNLEIAGSHQYFVHGRRVLTHNTYGAAGGLPTLPTFVPGGRTAGVLRTASGDLPLQSGWRGPASSVPSGTPGFDIVTRTHVEGHAAAAMRASGISEATLYINNPAICTSCANLLPRMLPPGSRLTVVTPGGSTTFVGIAP